MEIRRSQYTGTGDEPSRETLDRYTRFSQFQRDERSGGWAILMRHPAEPWAGWSHTLLVLSQDEVDLLIAAVEAEPPGEAAP